MNRAVLSVAHPAARRSARLRSRAAAAVKSLLASAVAVLLVGGRAGADVSVKLSAGFDGNVRAGAWNPLTLLITNPSYTGAAQLQVLVRTVQSGSQTYTQTVRLHAGQNADPVTAYYYQPDIGLAPKVSVQLVADGRTIAQKDLDTALEVPDGAPVVLGLTQDQSGLNFLSAVDLGVEHRDAPVDPGRTYGYQYYSGYGAYRRYGNRTAAGKNPTRVLYPRGSLLPDNAFGYGPVDLIALGDLPLDLLSEDQWNALVRWVKDGGTLVVSGGSDVNRARSKALASILPMDVTGVKQVHALPSLAEQLGAAPRIGSTAVLTGTLKQGATYVCEDDGNPTVSLWRVGNGTVALTAFDLFAQEFRAWPGQAKLWQECAQRGATVYRVAAAIRAESQPGPDMPWGARQSADRGLMDALAGVQATEAPSFKVIGGFLLLYILVLVPVNYLVLKRWDRKELAWITLPAIILFFSGGAYAVGYSIKGGELHVHACSVIEGAANDDGYAAYTIANVFSPRQQRYTISVADPYALPSEITEGSSFQRATSDLTVDRGQRTAVKDALINMWDHRTFDFESHVSLGGSIAASVEPAGVRTLRVTVANGTGRSLTDCSLSFRGSQAMVGNLAAGESKSVSIAVGDSAGPGISVVAGASGSANQTATLIRQALATMASESSTMVDPNGQGAAPAAGPFVFTGWFDGDVAGLALDGEKPKTTDVDLLVVHMPTPKGYEPPLRTVVGTPLPGSGGNPFGPGPFRINVNGSPPPGFMRMLNPAAQANSLNNQAYTYANQGRLDLAMKAANQAIKLAPYDGNIMDSVAEMHQRRKEYAAAASDYARALRLQGRAGLCETHEKYGETLLALGRRAEGISQLQQAAVSTGQPYAQRALQKLQQLGVAVRL